MLVSNKITIIFNSNFIAILGPIFYFNKFSYCMYNGAIAKLTDIIKKFIKIFFITEVSGA